jgi:diacylglycerol kinase (ATP)
MKPLVILNPNSQCGKTGEQAGELLHVIERYVGETDRTDTEHPRHAVDIAERAAKDGREVVIVVGGDGTVHEVTNGLMKARSEVEALPKVGVIGQGTGGDFRKTLGIDHRLDRYCETIANKKTTSIDMGEFSYRDRAGQDASAYFVNILSVGMGGLVDQYVAESSGAFGGTVAYFMASAKALLKSEVGILDCVVHEGGESREVELFTRQIAICNGRFFGGGMEVAPMAKIDDGLFNVVSMGAAGKVKFALGSGAIYSGKHVEQPEVEVFSCDRIDIEIRNDSIREIFPLDVDGEPLGTLPISVKLVRGAIDVFVA